VVFGLFTTDEKRNKGWTVLRLEGKLQVALSDFLQLEESGGRIPPRPDWLLASATEKRAWSPF
jgi:hypothetical protein